MISPCAALLTGRMFPQTVHGFDAASVIEEACAYFRYLFALYLANERREIVYGSDAECGEDLCAMWEFASAAAHAGAKVLFQVSAIGQASGVHAVHVSEFLELQLYGAGPQDAPEEAADLS